MLELEGFDATGRAADMPVQPVAECAAYMVSKDFDGRAEIWSVVGGRVHVTRLIASKGIDIPAAEMSMPPSAARPSSSNAPPARPTTTGPARRRPAARPAGLLRRKSAAAPPIRISARTR